MVDWINISQNSGSGNATITVTASSYNELLERSTALTVRSGDKSATVTINQRYNENFVVSPSSIDGIPYAGTAYTVSVTSNSSWSVVSKPFWVSVNQNSGTGNANIAIGVEGNSGLTRSGDIVFQSAGGLQRTLSLSQVAYYTDVEELSVSPMAYSGSSDSNYFVMKVFSNTAWTITAPSWIHTSIWYGSGNSENIIVVVSANTGDSRADDIVVNTQNLTRRISVSQSGHYTPNEFSISPSALTFDCWSGTAEVTINATGAWDLEPEVGFVSVSRSSGLAGTYKVTVTVSQNNSNSARTSFIRLYPRYGYDVYDVTITQAAYEVPHVNMGDYYTFVNFGRQGGMVAVDFTGNTPTIFPNTSTGNTYGGTWWSGGYDNTFKSYTSGNSIIITKDEVECGGPDSIVDVYNGNLISGTVINTIFLAQSGSTNGEYTITATYNITTTSEPTILFLGLNPAAIDSIKIDGTAIDKGTLIYDVDRTFVPIPYRVPSITTKKTFGSTGSHTVEVTVKNEEINFAAASALTALNITSNIEAFLAGSIRLISTNVVPSYYKITNSDICGTMQGTIDITNVTVIGNSALEGGIKDGVHRLQPSAIICRNTTAPTLEGSLGLMEGPIYSPYEVHVPSGSNYSSWASALPMGWKLVYDL